MNSVLCAYAAKLIQEGIMEKTGNTVPPIMMFVLSELVIVELSFLESCFVGVIIQFFASAARHPTDGLYLLRFPFRIFGIFPGRLKCVTISISLGQTRARLLLISLVSHQT